MRVKHDAWQCEKCGHIWLAMDDKAPEKCAKCKSRKWNRAEDVVTTVMGFTITREMREAAIAAAKRLPYAAHVKPYERSLENEPAEPEERVIDTSSEYAQ